jgi:hypothetical protein
MRKSDSAVQGTKFGQRFENYRNRRESCGFVFNANFLVAVQGIIWRFKFLMLATLLTAALTVIGFIIGKFNTGITIGTKCQQTFTLKFS